ncbi:Trehalose/maltose import ATP-binding protein MalK [uncultured archaeon]|nr:Trehalose/maltose import ATP-binding protein MalK [uncultured archaeon]
MVTNNKNEDEVKYAIECKNLTKKFGNFTAVNSSDLKIKKGELFGFLGPNGAGKTTTIKILTTLLSPTFGEAKVAGFDIKTGAASVRARIGVVPQEFALFGELTPMENLWYIGELFGMKKDGLKKRSEELLKKVELFDKKDIAAEGFSGGMKQRLSVAAGLLHTPEILFMDEPTTGLDPQSRIALRELTKSLNDSGITVVYTTHDMDEADKLCQRIAIMDAGKIKAEGTPKELKEKYGGGQKIELRLSRYDARLLEELKKISGAKSVLNKNGIIELKIDAPKTGILHKLSRFLAEKGIEVDEIRLIESSLEDVFINLTKKEVKNT